MAAAEPLPQFRRPTRETAIQHAAEMFLRGERVDMHTLSASLGIGRTTLYRWVGDRDQLLSEVLAGLTTMTWAHAITTAEGTGWDRAMDAGRRFMEWTAAFPPLHRFAQREPQLALRILMADDGPVLRANCAGFTRALTENVPPDTMPSPETIEIAVQAGTALEWTPIVIGRPPEIARAGRLISALFGTAWEPGTTKAPGTGAL